MSWGGELVLCACVHGLQPGAPAGVVERVDEAEGDWPAVPSGLQALNQISES